jgi:putative ABC transport system permease protein
MFLTKFYKNVRLGIKNLLLHKLRSMLTMLGVVFGVGSVVAMLSVGEGAKAEALARIEKLGSRNILINSKEPVEEGQSTQRRRLTSYGIKYNDIDRIRETIPGVARVVPAKTVRKQARLDRRVEELRLVGTTQDWPDLVRREMITGRHLASQDVERSNDVVVLTEQGARKLLATEGTLGQQIKIGGGSYQVIGIVASVDGGEGGGDKGGLPTPDENVDAYVPLPLLKERLGDLVVDTNGGNFNREQVELHQAIVEVVEQNNVPAVASGVQRMFEEFHDKVDYEMIVPLQLIQEAAATQRTFNVVLGSIAGISLLVGGIGIMNIMLASVTERTREIGIRRAIGAKKKQIIIQFLIETVVLSTVGGLIGIGLGLGIPLVIEYYAGMPTLVAPWMIGLSVGISMLVGIVFGLYPAVRAANLDPIQALRHE